MIASSVSWYSVDPMFFAIPGAFLFLTVLSLTVLGRQDPRGHRRRGRPPDDPLSSLGRLGRGRADPAGRLPVHLSDLLQAVAGPGGDDLRQDLYAGPDRLDPRRARARTSRSSPSSGSSCGASSPAATTARANCHCPAPCLGYSFQTNESVWSMITAPAPGQRHGRGRRRRAVAARRRDRRSAQRDQAGHVVGPHRDGTRPRRRQRAELRARARAAVRAGGEAAGAAVPVGAGVRRRPGAVVRVVPDAVDRAGRRLRLSVRAVDPEPT